MSQRIVHDMVLKELHSEADEKPVMYEFGHGSYDPPLPMENFEFYGEGEASQMAGAQENEDEVSHGQTLS